MRTLVNIKTALALLLLIPTVSGCDEWLSADPEDKVLEDQVFRNEGNIQRALNGIYLKMGENTLYGLNLSVFVPELQAQTYNIPAAVIDNTPKGLIAQYDYLDGDVILLFSNIWAYAYGLILETNLFLKNIDKVGPGIITDAKRELLTGEAYAARAYMHFDLLRLFGPVYATDPDAVSIPYYTKPGNEWQTRKKASEIIALVLADIDTALGLLAGDPVLTEGVRKADGDFYAWRNRRLNYYAVQALKARVLMYKGDKAQAASIARSLIDDADFGTHFPWADPEKVLQKDTPDMVFSDEVLFGVHVQSMYLNRDSYFSPASFSESEVLAMAEGNMKYYFGNNVGDNDQIVPDYRFRNWERYKNPEYYLPVKFRKPNKKADFSYFMPLIRKSELYLIAAEGEGAPSAVDAIRTHRGLKTLQEEMGDSYDLQQQIGIEFFKETYGEGQYFFYFKRRNQPEIRNMDGKGEMVTMNETTYIVPVPATETDK